MRLRPAAPLLVAVAATYYYAACSLLLLATFHANGWDLGFVDQMLWNTAHGRWWEHSFRESLYIADHWQPVLLLFVPLQWIGIGATGLLVAQAVLLGAAAVPLHAAARRLAGASAAWAAVAAYAFGLGVARAVAFDFHTEAFAPLLAFSALWALASDRPRVFVTAALALLLVKEDAALLVLALCWVGWIGFRWRALPAAVALAAVVYAAAVNVWLIPHFREDGSSALVARYGYLGDSFGEIVWSLATRPQLAFEQLVSADVAGAVLLLLLGAGFLPLLVPRLLPALALVAVAPLLSIAPVQHRLELHYMLVPATVAMVLAVVALRGGLPAWLTRIVPASAAARGWAAIAAGVFLLLSPLPPSFGAEWERFKLDAHSRVANDFVRQVPEGAVVSAQSSFVPRLAQRLDIYQFPRVLNAEYVLLDRLAAIPGSDLAAGYDACLGALPRLGFDLVREQSGISLWRKARDSVSVPEVPVWCSGQHG